MSSPHNPNTEEQKILYIQPALLNNHARLIFSHSHVYFDTEVQVQFTQIPYKYNMQTEL